MSYDYSGLAQTALDLIENFGRPVTLRRNTRVIDGVEGTATTTGRDIQATAVVLGMSASYAQQITANGGSIHQGDRMALIADAQPLISDLLIDGARWQVLSVDELRPGDTALLYKAQVRK